jgi:hypothetical protein
VEKSVVVVHGVGDPLPGNALQGLIESLTAKQWEVDTPLTIEHRDETEEQGAGDDEKRRQFPVARASLTRGADRLTLREVYWGDLSRPKGSLFGLVSALFDLIFGLRYIVTAAAHEMTTRTGRWAAQLARASLWWARGPLFALNILGAMVCLTYVGMIGLGWPALTALAPIAAVMFSSLACAGLGYYIQRRAKQLQWTPATGQAMVAIGVVSLILALVFSGHIARDLGAFIGNASSWTGWTDVLTLTGMMLVFACVMVGMALASLLLCLGTVVLSKVEKTGHLTVVAFCTSIALGLFTFAVVSIWVLIARTIREGTSDRVERCIKGLPDRLQRCLDSEVWVPEGTQLALRVEQGIHLLPLMIFGFFAIASAFAAVMIGNWLLRSGKEDQRFRYIVSRLVVGTTWIVTAGYSVLFLYLAWSIVVHGKAQIPEWATLEALKPWALATTAVIAGVVTAKQAKFLVALDLVLDVIAHFRTEHEGKSGGEGTHRGWVRIVNRFKKVVGEELGKPGRRVVVLGHSQGTAIAAHGLGAFIDRRCQPRVEPVEGADSVQLVTMGSPLQHLYRHYMPLRYSANSEAVASWLNIYRIDDYIGTTLKAPDRANATDVFDKRFEEKSIGKGGHIDYWSDSRAIDHIVKVIDASAP